MTNVPQPTFGLNGFVAPAEVDVLTGVLADLNDAFGGNLNTDSLESPQGQLATTEAANISAANDLFCELTQQMDPAFAAGRMQDAIGRIYFITRNPAEPTTVACLCSGLTGVTIPAGAQAIATDGNVYTCVTGGTIPVAGNITLSFTCNVAGPIACPANTLNGIYQAIPGWDSINNVSDGVLGSTTESRAAFEARRQESVAKNSKGTIQAIQGAVLAVNGVLDAFSYQNEAGTPLTYRGVTIPGNSIYVAAVGGTDLDVATAIWTKKSPGCGYSGSTIVNVQDTDGYNFPYPTYPVAFQRPTNITIQFMVQLANNPGIPSDATLQIQNAIINAFAGGDGGVRARIGSTIYATRFISAIAALGSWAQVISMLIMQGTAPAVTFTASQAGTTLTVTAVGSNSLAAGQLLTGAGFNNKLIVAQLTGTAGGVGTYQLSASQTFVSGALNAFATTQNSVGLNINQAPVTSAANIFVVLT